MNLDLFSMLVGGLLTMGALWLYRQLKAGKIELPPTVELGPIKIVFSGFSKPESFAQRHPSETSQHAESQDEQAAVSSSTIHPRALTSDSPNATTPHGWVATLGGALVLLGFILPWATCNISYVLSGSVSGLNALIQLLVGGVLSFLLGSSGLGNPSSGAAGAGFVAFLFFVLLTVILLVVPYSGWRIAQVGYRITQSLIRSTPGLRDASKFIMKTAVIGAVPLLCVLATTLNISTPSFIGNFVFVRQIDIGIWVTIAGFALAAFAALQLGTFATHRALNEERHSNPIDQELSRSDQVSGQPLD